MFLTGLVECFSVAKLSGFQLFISKYFHTSPGIGTISFYWKGIFMNDKVLIIAIFTILGIGMISVLFIAVPWLVNYALPNWRESLVDSGIVIVALILFVYGFYMNTKMH